MPGSSSSCRMLLGQRSGKQQGRARSLVWKRSDPESSISTPSPLTLASLYIGRGVRKTPTSFGLIRCLHGRRLRKSFPRLLAFFPFFQGRRLRKSCPPISFDDWNRETFRFGEALHPGPCQRIVTVNPQG
eukprot:4326869-Amphidinium_carterae.1